MSDENEIREYNQLVLNCAVEDRTEDLNARLAESVAFPAEGESTATAWPMSAATVPRTNVQYVSDDEMIDMAKRPPTAFIDVNSENEDEDEGERDGDESQSPEKASALHEKMVDELGHLANARYIRADMKRSKRPQLLIHERKHAGQHMAKRLTQLFDTIQELYPSARRGRDGMGKFNKKSLVNWEQVLSAAKKASVNPRQNHQEYTKADARGVQCR
ncbi:hypothetical protein BZG36_01410 [Bifiguratus adelaidae]|uniref:Uncharacterized protein n=1 Tax=Bifiguratus adelaidae TaxID=1938954 RepID=A0A261Y5F5_9FUNG|nr:hypothetical protein BZG36_01410 [Bifiguratus adelaidae]